MATVSGSQFGAGGKIVSNRRKKRLATTPYDRPQPPPPPPPRSPNWFSGLIIPSARALASGAGKILSSVLYFDSSSSSEDNGPASEDEVDNDNEYNINSDGLNEFKQGTSPEMIECRQDSQESQFRVRKNETKRLIEQLIMQEMFSREECDRLIDIINSRIVDFSTMKTGETSLYTVTPGGTVGNENVDLCNTTVEAKKWFEENKVKSSPVMDLAQGTCGFNSIVLDNIEEVGLPVDMAKSYMKARPPWASPTKQIELRTPSTMKMAHFQERTPYSVGNDSQSSFKKRNSLASGSWNIQEELRRVRSKATEDMLRTLSSKIDLPLALKSSQEYFEADILTAGLQHEKSGLDSSTVTKPIGAPTNLDAGGKSNPVLLGLSSRQDGAVIEVLPSKQTTSATQKNKDSEATWFKGECTASRSAHPTSSDNAVEHHDDQHLSKITGSVENKITEFSTRQSSNGFPSSETRLSAGENHVLSDEANHNNTANQKNLTNMIPVEDKCELHSEAYIEVPILTEIDSIPGGSPNSFSMQYEESSPERSQPANKNVLAEKANAMGGKQQGRKPGKYIRRGRGRGN